MEVILRLLGSILSIYMLLIFIRILLTWFSGASLGRPVEILRSITDPYLNIFRRIPFLRTGRIDFSPIAAIISLVIVLNIINTVRFYGQISLGIVLALIVQALWSAVFFILMFFGILTAVRFVSLLASGTSFTQFWQTLDTLINPVLGYVQRVVFRGRQLSYRTGIGVSALLIVSAAFIGRFLVSVLVSLLRDLPI